MKNSNTKRIARYLVPSLLIAVAAVFIYVGIARGEHDQVLNKAIAICMECIGIG
ncbi:MAG: hypothetical protein IJA35_01330 [Clostridia bacterium]|nr:hypothetical protein [Clostridia bacterium]